MPPQTVSVQIHEVEEFRSSTNLLTDNLKKKKCIGITIHKRIQKIKLANQMV